MEKSHKNLKVWQTAMELIKMVYTETAKLPREERFGLAQQMRRAAVSIASNIAEGAARKGTKEAVQFFLISRGPISELDTQICICEELHYFDQPIVSSLTSLLERADLLLSGLIRYRRGGKQ